MYHLYHRWLWNRIDNNEYYVIGWIYWVLSKKCVPLFENWKEDFEPREMIYVTFDIIINFTNENDE